MIASCISPEKRILACAVRMGFPELHISSVNCRQQDGDSVGSETFTPLRKAKNLNHTLNSIQKTSFEYSCVQPIVTFK